jgi:soluble lytic murein transglycosylase-like protein
MTTKRLLFRGGALLVAAALVSVLGGWTEHTRAADAAVIPDASFVSRPVDSLADQLADARGELAMVKLQLDRAKAIVGYSTRYQIPADLASAIYDVARSEDIDPSLAYRLVKIESNFKANARSEMNAIGYTQLQLGTARFYQPGVTEEQLFDRDVNLRIGLRFLSDLLAKFDNDVHLALLAYNRGPARIEQILASGGDPKNGYSEAVLRGYRPPPPVR